MMCNCENELCAHAGHPCNRPVGQQRGSRGQDVMCDDCSTRVPHKNESKLWLTKLELHTLVREMATRALTERETCDACGERPDDCKCGLTEAECDEVDEQDNPWAICHASTGPKKTKGFERCVRGVKKRMGKE